MNAVLLWLRELFRQDKADYNFNCHCFKFDTITITGSGYSDPLTKRRMICRGCERLTGEE